MSLGRKSRFRIFKMIFCSIKINTIQFSTDLFVLGSKDKQVMNFRNVKLVSGSTAPYCPKWCPVITLSKKVDFGVITRHVSQFPIMIFIKKDISVDPHACVNVFFDEDDEI